MRTVFSRAIFLAVLLLNVPAQSQETLRIAAVVNDEIISAYDLSSRLTLVLASSGAEDRLETRRRLAKQVLRGLIDEKLKLQESRRLDIHITKKDINKALAKLERRNKLPKGGLNNFLARFNIDKSILIDQLEAELAWSKTVSRKLRMTIQIGEDEIDEMISRINANKGKPEHLVAEIFLPVDDPQSEGEMQQLAKRLFQQLKEGASFPALAKSFSKNATAKAGGNLGWVSPGQLGSEFDGALLKMQPGQISPPFLTESGYHILLLVDRRIGKGLPAKEVTATLEQLFLPLSAKPNPADVSSQMALAETMAEVANNCQDMKKLANEFGTQMSGSLGKVKLSKLPSDLRKVVENLPVGKASRPQRTPEGIVVIMVCDREEDTLDVDARRKIKRMLLEQRLDMLARHYLRDLRRAAFIDVRL